MPCPSVYIKIYPVENVPPERFQNQRTASGTQGGAVLFAPSSKSCRFSHPPSPCAKSMAQGVSPSADGDSEGYSPSKNTSPTVLSWISLMGQQLQNRSVSARWFLIFAVRIFPYRVSIPRINPAFCATINACPKQTRILN